MMPLHQLKRTASMTGLPAAPGGDASPEQTDPRHTESHRVSAARRRSVKLLRPDTATFLRACGLCNRRLGPGRDTFMYRGEIAFCSLECREQKIIQDEWMEKCSLTSMKKDTPMAAAAGTEASSGIETIAAA